MSEHSPVERLRIARAGGYTQRFHTIRRIHQETVGQHVYGGLATLHALTDGAVSRDLLWAWVFHDSPEKLYGDIPAPSKRDMGEAFSKAWNARETAYNAEWGMDHPLSPREHGLLKLVDCLDGLYSCLEERRLGNRDIVEAYPNYLNYTKKLLAEGKDLIYSPSIWSRAMDMVAAAVTEWNKITGDNYER